MNAETDTSLLHRWCAQRDARAFREIAQRHSQMVFATCRRILRDPAEAEDIAQECFLTLAQHAERPPDSLPAWLHVIAVRRALNRRRARDRQTAREHAFAESRAASVEPTLDLLLGEVDAALAGLPETLRVPLVLHFLEQHSQDEIAKLLKVSQSTISRRIDQGITQLRAALNLLKVPITATALAAALHAEASAAAPATLTAALGKLSLAGKTAGLAATTTSPSATLGTLGGTLLMKKILLATGVLVLLAGGALFFLPTDKPTPSPNTPAEEQRDQSKAETAPDSKAARAPDSAQSLERLSATSTGAAPEAAGPESPEPETNVLQGGTISGHVLDAATSAGIAGVTITAEWGFSDSPAIPPANSATAVSDAGGAYQLTGLKAPAGTKFRLKRDAPAGYRLQTFTEQLQVTLTASGSATGVDFLLRKEAALSGVVVDEVDRPVAGAKVLVAGGSDLYVAETATSESDGSFAFHSLPASGDLHIVATKESGLSSEPLSFSLPDEGISDLVIVMLAACTVSGTVVDAQGKPLEGCHVLSLRVPDSRIGAGETKDTDAAGRFKITGLPSGTYELIATRSRHTGTDQQGLPIELAPGEHLENVKLVYNRDLTIAGRVTNLDGEPIAEAHIQAGSTEHGGSQAKSDDAGLFAIADLEEGDYQLDVRAKDYQAATFGGIPAGTKDFEIVLPDPFRVSGRVLDAGTGQPLPQFEIVLNIGWEDHLSSWAEKQFTKVSNPEGRFELTQIQLYRSVLAARAPGYAMAMEFLDLTGPPYEHEVELRLQPGADLEGRVVDDQGEPIAGAGVFWGQVVAVGGDRSSTQTLADGSFRLPSFPAQPQLISAYHPNYAPGSLLIDGAHRPQPVEIVLSEGGTVQGTVTFAEGIDPLPSEVTVTYDEQHFILDAKAGVAADGSYSLGRVRPGPVEVILAVNSEGPWQQIFRLAKPATIENGVTAIVDFDVQPLTAGLEGVVKPPKDALPSRIQLMLEMQSASGTISRTALALPGGAFYFEDVPTGSGEIKIDAMFQNHPRIATTVPVEISETDSYLEIPL